VVCVAERPEYLRIAAELRDQITSGPWRPATACPTLPELCAEYGVSETTVRNAVGVLRGEGLVETRTRAGTVVRERPPVHRLAADRYKTPPGGPPQTAFTRDQGIGWSEYRLDKRFEQVKAGPQLAACSRRARRAAARPALRVLRQRPAHADVHELRALVRRSGTPVADPINEPWPGGTRAQLATLGIEVTRITEAFTVGMPTRIEAETLRIGARCQ
jgi:GntR family transcriptional regulator